MTSDAVFLTIHQKNRHKISDRRTGLKADLLAFRSPLTSAFLWRLYHILCYIKTLDMGLQGRDP